MGIIKSKELVDIIEQEVKDKVNKLPIQPSLAIIQVGEDPASTVYVNNKIKACNRVGINPIHVKLEEDVKWFKMSQVISGLKADPSVNGIIVQQPLPEHLNPSAIQNLIDEDRDVDGFGKDSMAAVMMKGFNSNYHIPATPLGIMTWIDYLNYDLTGKNVVIIGRSNTVSKPLAMLMLSKDATVTICHSKTKHLKFICQDADVIVSAIGKPKFINSHYVNDNQLIIDVGINRDENGKLCGDVDPEVVNQRPNITLTAVPGGVGPLTVASLLKNTVK